MVAAAVLDPAGGLPVYATATDGAGRTRLHRWRWSEAYFIDDDRLDQLAGRIDDLQGELNALRPPVTKE